MNFYVYILYSQGFDKFYVGQTNNLNNRLERHNKGYVRSTKAYKPWRLVYWEEYNSRKESMEREKYIKSQKSKTYIQDLLEASR